jgi:hypothetical protein
MTERLSSLNGESPEATLASLREETLRTPLIPEHAAHGGLHMSRDSQERSLVGDVAELTEEEVVAMVRRARTLAYLPSHPGHSL